MLPAALISWRGRLNWSAAEAARQLGLARNTYMAYEAGTHPIPLYVAYACQAIANGLPPMK
jgi:transcriptional regulator with XRE-family HTH domain